MISSAGSPVRDSTISRGERGDGQIDVLDVQTWCRFRGERSGPTTSGSMTGTGGIFGMRASVPTRREASTAASTAPITAKSAGCSIATASRARSRPNVSVSPVWCWDLSVFGLVRVGQFGREFRQPVRPSAAHPLGLEVRGRDGGGVARGDPRRPVPPPRTGRGGEHDLVSSRFPIASVGRCPADGDSGFTAGSGSPSPRRRTAPTLNA